MQAVLYIAHGTRLQAGVKEATDFVNYHMKMVKAPIQVMSFIDLASPSIEEGIEICVQQGAKQIALVPILLLEAGHAKYDIPKAIMQASKQYPHITFTYGAPFGVDDKMIQTMVERLVEQGPIKEDASILIVARGSSDNRIREDFAQLVEGLQRYVPVRHIDVCYLAAQKPNLQAGIAAQIASGRSTVYVLPYLLFTGLLMEHLEEVITYSQSPEQTYHLCRPLGRSQHITDLFIQRIQEAIVGEAYDLSSTAY